MLRVLQRFFSSLLVCLLLAATFPMTGGATSPGQNGRLAYAVQNESNHTTSIYGIDPDGTDRSELLSFPEVAAVNGMVNPDVDSLTWSPDGSKLAFTRDLNIYTVNADGSGLMQVTDVPAERYDIGYYGVSWSNDGIYLLGHRAGWGDTQLMSAEGNYVQTYYGGSSVYDVKWSPTSNILASSTFIPGSYGGLIVFTPGNEPRTLAQGTASTGVYAQPDWAPDGTKLVYQRGYEDLGIVSVHGGTPTDIGLKGWYPVWSPSGAQLAYLKRDGNNGLKSVVVTNVTMPGETVIVTEQNKITDLSWQPLSNKMVYRLANWKTHERLFTTNPEEVVFATRNLDGWIYEGVAMRTFSSAGDGRVPVYRMANWKTHERLFTTNLEEANYAVAHYEGWVLEGIAFYASATPTGTPVYRLSNWHSQERLFTTSSEEASTVPHTFYGWVYEGIAFYAP